MDIAGQSGSLRESVQGIPMEMAVESEFFSTSTKRGPCGLMRVEKSPAATCCEASTISLTGLPTRRTANMKSGT